MSDNKQPRVAMTSTSERVRIDEKWAAGQELPAIPTPCAFMRLYMNGDLTGLREIRDAAVFYRALAAGYEVTIAQKNEEIETLRDKLYGGKAE